MEDSYCRKPQIRIGEQKGDKFSFFISGTDTSMVNGLRRVIISETPTVAINHVKIIENTTYLCDEYIAHRLSLIPLDCSRCPDFSEDDQTYYEICVMNTAVSDDDRQSTITVTSNDLKHIGGRKLFPVHSGEEKAPIPIVELGRRQRLHIECTATRGIGKFHAKWNPTSECVFRTFADIKINNEKAMTLSEEEKLTFVEKCPRQVFECVGLEQKINVLHPDQCIFCDECLVYASDINKRGLVTVVPQTDNFLFKIEGTGVYPPKVIVKKALEEMKAKFSFLKQQLEYQTN